MKLAINCPCSLSTGLIASTNTQNRKSGSWIAERKAVRRRCILKGNIVTIEKTGKIVNITEDELCKGDILLLQAGGRAVNEYFVGTVMR